MEITYITLLTLHFSRMLLTTVPVHILMGTGVSFQSEGNFPLSIACYVQIEILVHAYQAFWRSLCTYIHGVVLRSGVLFLTKVSRSKRGKNGILDGFI